MAGSNGALQIVDVRIRVRLTGILYAEGKVERDNLHTEALSHFHGQETTAAARI